jgi:hypothetical protein
MLLDEGDRMEENKYRHYGRCKNELSKAEKFIGLGFISTLFLQGAFFLDSFALTFMSAGFMGDVFSPFLFLRVLLIIGAYFAYHKRNMKVCFAMPFVFFITATSDVFSAFIGAFGGIVSIICIFAVKKYKELEAMEGFPYFNERFSEREDTEPTVYKFAEKKPDGEIETVKEINDGLAEFEKKPIYEMKAVSSDSGDDSNLMKNTDNNIYMKDVSED